MTDPIILAEIDKLKPIDLFHDPIPEPDVGPKWPMWKSTAFLITFCSGAWAAGAFATTFLLRLAA